MFTQVQIDEFDQQFARMAENVVRERRLLFLLCALASTMTPACENALAAGNVTQIQDGQRQFARIYDPAVGPPEAHQRARAGYCVLDRALRDIDAGQALDSGILCERVVLP
jgi:hypothetical protein